MVDGVKAWEVPIFLSLEAEHGYNQVVEITSDIMQQKIRPLIDGKRHVKKIALEANMDIEIVKMCIQHLVHYKIVSLIDIFQFNNVYAATPQITSLAQDRVMQEKCIDYVIRRCKAQYQSSMKLIIDKLQSSTE